MCENIRRQKALNTICICAVIALLLSLVFMAIFSTTTASAEDQLTSGADSTISTPSDTAADLGAIKNITIILEILHFILYNQINHTGVKRYVGQQFAFTAFKYNAEEAYKGKSAKIAACNRRGQI